MQTRYKDKIKTFMFIEYDELWYGGVKIRRNIKFNDALESVLTECANDSLIDCYVILRDIPFLLGTFFIKRDWFEKNEKFKLHIQ